MPGTMNMEVMLQEAFPENNPLKYTDPTGLEDDCSPNDWDGDGVDDHDYYDVESYTDGNNGSDVGGSSSGSGSGSGSSSGSEKKGTNTSEVNDAYAIYQSLYSPEGYSDYSMSFGFSGYFGPGGGFSWQMSGNGVAATYSLGVGIPGVNATAALTDAKLSSGNTVSLQGTLLGSATLTFSPGNGPITPNGSDERVYSTPIGNIIMTGDFEMAYPLNGASLSLNHTDFIDYRTIDFLGALLGN